MRLFIATAALLAILASACQRGAPETSETAHRAEPTSSQAAVPRVDPSLSVQDLRDRAAAALQGGRLLGPAAESALDLYLAAGERAPGDSEIRSAIEFLQPYAVIACEQAIAVGDLPEAQRLLELLHRGNPAAPSLPRLRVALAKSEAVEQAQALAPTEAVTQQASAEKEVALQPAEAGRSTSERSTLLEAAGSTPVLPNPGAPVLATTSDPVARPVERQIEARVPELPAAAQTPSAPSAVEVSRVRDPRAVMAAEAGAGSALPRIVQASAPRYPVIAMSRKIEGEVEVAFTILPDGRVSNARVTRAQPAGVFNRAALTAVEGYRFAPSGRSFDTSRTVNFRLSGI